MYQFRTKPYGYQLKAYRKIISRNSCALFVAPGGGKTKIAIDSVGFWSATQGLDKVLVITPKSVIGIWEEEIDIHLGYGVKEYQVIRLTEKRQNKITEIKQNKKVDCLTFFLMTPDSATLLSDELKKLKPDVVIMDESHYIKNQGSKRSKKIRSLGRVSKKRLALTGTPMPKNYLDLWAQLDFLESQYLGKWSWIQEYLPIWGGYMNYEIVGWKQKRIDGWLKEKVDEIAVNVSKDAFNLPPIIYQKVPIYLGKSISYYNEMAKNSVIELEELSVTANIVLTKMQKLQQITGGFVKDDDGNEKIVGHEKIEVLGELLEKHVIDGKQKVVVFARFIKEIETIQALCDKMKIPNASIRGEVSDIDRDKYRRDFQNPKGKIKVMVCQVATGGIGINLNQARVGIFYSMDFQLDHYEQCRDRLDRGDIKDSTTILFLVAKGTIDEEVMRRNKDKLGFSNIILGWKNLLGKVAEEF